jgi:hypothetical protein
MNLVLKISAIAEALTGLGLVVSPSPVIGLIFGGTVEGTGIIASRLAGLALIGLGLACWPGTTGKPAQLGMLVYSSRRRSTLPGWAPAANGLDPCCGRRWRVMGS